MCLTFAPTKPGRSLPWTVSPLRLIQRAARFERAHRQRLLVVGQSRPPLRTGRCPRRYVVIIASALVMCQVALTGCRRAADHPLYRGAGHKAPQAGGTFRFYHETNVRTLDPHVAYDELSIAALRLVYEPLLEFGPDGELAPGLAEALPSLSEDGLHYRLKLREDVVFQDGHPLDAEAVRASLYRMLAAKTGSPAAEFFTKVRGLAAYRAGRTDHIAGIIVEDAHTLRFELSEVDVAFPFALGLTFTSPIAPSALARAAAGERVPPLGTGPYRLESWERGVRLTYKANDNYHTPSARPERMVFYENVPRHLAIMRFRNGELDVLFSFSPADATFFRESAAWQPQVHENVDAIIGGIVMNCELPPFDNVHVRRAVAFALNRERWRAARGNSFVVWGQPLPPMFDGSLPPDHPSVQHYDLARARAELAKAGYPDGLPYPIELWLGESAGAQVSGQFAQADLAKIGITLELKPVSFAVFLEETSKRGRVPMFFSTWGQDFPDASSILDPLFHSRGIESDASQNSSFYVNEKLSRLLDQAHLTRDAEERNVLYATASKIIAEDAPWAFLYVPLRMTAYQPYVRNTTHHQVWSHAYESVWLDLPRMPWTHMQSARKAN